MEPTLISAKNRTQAIGSFWLTYFFVNESNDFFCFYTHLMIFSFPNIIANFFAIFFLTKKKKSYISSMLKTCTTVQKSIVNKNF